MRHYRRTAFTLVELLVVIAIIGVLVALLLPAVLGARESARQTECSNKLKNLGLAATNFKSFHQTFPTGGWGTNWTGDPDRGGKKAQPGSWIYSILPYLEQPALYKLGEDGDAETVTSEQSTKAATALTFPLDVLHCPSRRLPELRPSIAAYENAANTTSMTLKTDYAANGGTPSSADTGTTKMGGPSLSAGSYPDVTNFDWYESGEPNGVIYRHSAVNPALIRDGLSNTILFGEKLLNVDYYEDAMGDVSSGDAYSAFNSGDDTIRFLGTGGQPVNDSEAGALTGALPGNKRFGAAHTAGFIVAFADGHTKLLTYVIAPEILDRLAASADGLPIPADSF